MRTLLTLPILCFVTSAFAQQEPVSQKEIDAAIRSGAEYLKTAPSPGGHLSTNCDELILLTLIHAGVSERSTAPLLKRSLSAPLEFTYKVALLAMCLEELDATRYQGKIAQCAQFLVDNQAPNGQWSYGQIVDSVKTVPFDDKGVASEDRVGKRGEAREFGQKRERKKPRSSIAIKQTRTVGEVGDNSNSQYAALGLRACFDANIKLPPDCLHLARKWWAESMYADESGGARAGKNAVNSGGETTKIQGWSYKKPGEEGQKEATHPMTAGAVGALVIYEYLLGRDWRRDSVTKAGVNWLGKHFVVDEDYYYLYALERAGMLYGCETFGDHNWYWKGARFLVDKQNADGSWGKDTQWFYSVWDTCFAVLFLKKATRAIATVDPAGRK